MLDSPSFDPHRFQDAAAHYRSGRIPYPPSLIRRVAELVGLGEDCRVLDLGCGPGQLAIGLGYFAGDVIGVDPEPRMLAVAAEAARGLTSNVSFRRGSSFDLDSTLGQFRLVTMGRSFHWMDRADTLRRLNEIIETGGAIALFGDRHIEVPENKWHTEWRAITERYARDDAAKGSRRSGSWLSHESVLLNSPFCRLERISFVAQQVSPIDSLIERAQSMSSLSRERIGEGANQLTRDLRALLASVAAAGTVTEVVECSALIARRSRPASPARSRGNNPEHGRLATGCPG
jgi:SAM-dependent methyltransferase